MRNGSNIVLQDNIVEDMDPRDAMILFGNRDTIPSLSTAGNGLDKHYQTLLPYFLGKFFSESLKLKDALKQNAHISPVFSNITTPLATPLYPHLIYISLIHIASQIKLFQREN